MDRFYTSTTTAAPAITPPDQVEGSGGLSPGRRLAVDLFAGTGGATAALRMRGWRVVTVDLERRRHPDVVADAVELPLARGVDFLWASPPCTEFSDANPGRPARPSLELVLATLTAVRDLRPRFWVLENVRGAIRFLGIPVYKVGPWCLWGYFPPLRVTWRAQTYRKVQAGSSAVARGAVPWELSLALAEALDLYWTCPSLLDLRPFRRHRHRAARPGPAATGFWDEPRT